MWSCNTPLCQGKFLHPQLREKCLNCKGFTLLPTDLCFLYLGGICETAWPFLAPVLYVLSSPLGISLEALSVLEGPVIQLSRQLTCLEDAAVPADNGFVSHVMDGYVAQASPLSPRLWPYFSDSYLCPGYPVPAVKVSSCQCFTFSLGTSPGRGWGEGQRASLRD